MIQQLYHTFAKKSMKTLCVDLGNTRMKVGVFDASMLIHTSVLEKNIPEHLQKLIADYKPEKSILSSVVHHDKKIEEVMAAVPFFHMLGHHSILNFSLAVGKPETMGADRLALAAAVVHFFPNRHNLVIGLGSCITYNFINNAHVFLGGSIAPGLEMRLKSLKDYTALLPLVEKDWNFPLIGYDTRTNILSGVILGMAKEIEGIIEAYQEKYRNFNVVLTGGDCKFFERLLKKKIFADPDLLFKGLYAISETNN